MDDLISRQQAIDAMKEHRALYCDNTPDTFSKLSYAEKSRVDELDTAIATLVNLPPAQPQACDDAISRKMAIDAVNKLVEWYKEKWHESRPTSESVIDVLNDLPSAQPQRKKGKWIKLDMHEHLADHKCTACGKECYVPTCMGEPMYTYCPNCGARME